MQPGVKLGIYTYQAFIGSGSMAQVHRVVDPEGMPWALKVLQTLDTTTRQRLFAEGRVMAKLNHPNVVAVKDGMEIDDRPALVLELVNGPTLAEWLAVYRPTVDEALAVFRGIARGVQAAHEAGLIHRDLKPENVLLDVRDDGVVPKLADFGLVKVLHGSSKLTLPGMVLGTPEYAAPEQIRDASDVDHRADLFSLGCLLYEMVTGSVAFARPDLPSVYQAIQSSDYLPAQTANPDVPDYVSTLIDQLLSPNPADRPESCAALLEEVYLDDVPPITQGVSESSPEFAQWSFAALQGPALQHARALVRQSLPRPSVAKPARVSVWAGLGLCALGALTLWMWTRA